MSDIQDARVCSATGWEASAIASLVASQSATFGVYLEIGSFRGGSLVRYGGSMWADSLLIAVDRPMVKAGDLLQKNAQALRERGFSVEVVLGDSHQDETLDAVKSILGERRVDVLLVDGDHSPAGCEKDLSMYLPLVRPGGMVILHDAGMSEPRCAIREETAPVIAGLHEVWVKWSKGKRRMLIQDWAGYGIFWTGGAPC